MTDVPNPLNLFWRFVQDDDHSATEVLLFTFNHDLAFFERSALGMIQQTGARITIIADTRMAHHDLYAVRRAGGGVPSRARPLPRLVPPEGARDRFGGPSGASRSARATCRCRGGRAMDESSGASMRPTPAADPRVVHDLGLVAATAAGIVRGGDGVSEAMAPYRHLVERLATTDSSARLVHTLDQPIIEQLPEGPVDTLALYAPFHDPGAHAVRALLERFHRPLSMLASNRR